MCEALRCCDVDMSVREPTAFDAAVDAVASGSSDVEDAARGLVDRLDDSELLWLLDGDSAQARGLAQMARRYNATPIEAGRIDRLGIPGIRFTDGPRGVVMGAATAFPVAVARAATWDPALERAVGEAIGRRRGPWVLTSSRGCVNLAPAPGWGRSQESYGEDPVLLGAMGSALVEGVHPWVMSCVKHYALNSMEEARFVVDVQVDEDVLHEVYLPHFRQVVEVGADAVMSAYNKVNGVHAGENRHLLNDILRDQWGFDGFTMSDFVWGIRDPVGPWEALGRMWRCLCGSSAPGRSRGPWKRGGWPAGRRRSRGFAWSPRRSGGLCAPTPHRHLTWWPALSTANWHARSRRVQRCCCATNSMAGRCSRWLSSRWPAWLSWDGWPMSPTSAITARRASVRPTS